MDATPSRIWCGKRDKKGIENVVADHLSRLESSEMEVEKGSSIKEEFSYEYLFSVSITL